MPAEARAKLAPLATTLTRSGWRWGALLQQALATETPHGSPIAGMEAWRSLPQWEDEAPVGTPGTQPVAVGAAELIDVGRPLYDGGVLLAQPRNNVGVHIDVVQPDPMP